MKDTADSLANEAVTEIKKMMENPVIVKFVEDEAYKTISTIIGRSEDRCCTPKAAKLLVHNKKNSDIFKTWEAYCSAGYYGVWLAKH